MQDRKLFAIGLGFVALIADAITIIQFIDKSKFIFSSYYLAEEFWSFSWIMSIVLITMLYAIGVGLLSYGYDNTPEKPILFLGGLYIIGAQIIYLRWGYLQIGEELNFQSYSAITILFLLCTAIGLISIGVANEKYLRFPSYAYGVANIIFVFMLINKYVFSSNPFHWGFLGEALILIAGGIAFVGLFFFDEW